MKHTPRIVLILLSLFLLTQIIGLRITSHYLKLYEQVPKGSSFSFVPIVVMVLIATLLALLLFKFKLFKIWKIWFLLSVWFMLTISLSAFIPENIAMIIAGALSLLKVLRPTALLHNLTELFIYGALSAILVPILNIVSVSILLVAISIYDFIAVRKTGHMVKLAKTQSKAKTFAGLAIPYDKRVAILGGGDMGFALLFAGVVMKEFSLSWLSLGAMIVPLCTMSALAILFYKGDNKKFYPAMPYITAGAFVGYGITWLLNSML